MTIEEARQVKQYDKVRLVNSHWNELNGSIGYIPWVDRIFDQEPHAVIFPWTGGFKGCYNLIKIENLELIKEGEKGYGYP
jgi:hypothetical protein